MRGQKGVEIDEGLAVEVGPEGAGIFEFGVVAQGLAELVEECIEGLAPLCGFAEQTGEADFLDVVGFQINLDAVECSGIKLSSKLLRLAEVIREEGLAK